LLKAHSIQISMDGTGCWRDNVFVERLWRSVKYEEVYLQASDSIRAAHQGVGRYLTFYKSATGSTLIFSTCSLWAAARTSATCWYATSFSALTFSNGGFC